MISLHAFIASVILFLGLLNISLMISLHAFIASVILFLGLLLCCGRVSGISFNGLLICLAGFFSSALSPPGSAVVVSAFLFTPCFFLIGGCVKSGPCPCTAPPPPPSSGLALIWLGTEDGVGAGGIEASLPASSLVTLILRAGLAAELGKLGRPSFFSGFTLIPGSFGCGLISCSSLGMEAILVRKSFSRVCAITTMSSPALL